MFRAFKGRQLSAALGLILLILAPFVTGCRSSPLFHASGPGWKLQEGQALWRPKRQMPEIGGEVVVASHADGRCCIEFSKTPLTLAMAQTSPTKWHVSFPPAQIRFTGRGNPSRRFLWLHLNSALSEKPLPKQIYFHHNADGTWRLENSQTGETIQGYLTP